jgi:hypothetical protein
MKKLFILFVIVCSCKSVDKNKSLDSEASRVDTISPSDLKKMQEMESQLINIFEESNQYLSMWFQHRDEADYDTMEYDYYKMDSLRDSFASSLMSAIVRYPASLKYDFPRFNDIDVYVYTSEDKKFRIYGWFDDGDGTMHTHTNIFQFEGKSVRSQKTEEELARYDSVFTFHFNGRTVYIATYVYRASSAYYGSGFQFFEIQNDTLNTDVPMVETVKDTLSNLSINYRGYDDSGSRSTICTDNCRTLKIRALAKDENFPDEDVLTNEYTTYHFNGRYFEEVKE